MALTIAGSDSGGGAGIQADLKAFAALGVHGTSAITCITAQNPDRVFGIQACRPEMVRQQIEAVFDGLKPDAVKTGMLYSTEIIRVVARFFQHRRRTLLVVDPVMVSTSGSRLLKPAAIKTMAKELLPLASLVTPNLDEAAVLTGKTLKSVEDMRKATREIRELYGCAVLVKGGHLGGMKEAVDIFYDGETELLLAAPFVKGVRTHGTGCTYSAAITAYLAAGVDLTTAVVRAKEHITQAIVRSRKVAGYKVLDNFPAQQRQ
ncbi:MAG: phosphomethylpyrimidine kinase [Pedosphaera sp.]|nr:phosphomethylpyrimidine kinase [Pedosphaera sp.]